MIHKEVIIIGAGPGGIASAIQLKRYGISFALLEKEHTGGRLWNANLVENYPGFPAGVSGPKLVKLLEKQLSRLGIRVVRDEVLHVSRPPNSDPMFAIKTQMSSFTCDHLIVASGTQPKPIPIEIPDACRERVFSDVWPLMSEENGHIIIIGAGDAAFDYALNLTKNRNSVTILNRGKNVQCLNLLWQRAMANEAITYRAEAPVRSVALDGTKTRLKVRLEMGETVGADFLLFAIGRIPQTEFLADALIEKNVKGLYFVGDVKNGLYRQVAIAAGDGLRAAMEIHAELIEEASTL